MKHVSNLLRIAFVSIVGFTACETELELAPDSSVDLEAKIIQETMGTSTSSIGANINESLINITIYVDDVATNGNGTSARPYSTVKAGLIRANTEMKNGKMVPSL